MRARLLLLAALSALFSATPLQAAIITTNQLVNVVAGGGGTYTYSVGGWTGGGTVTGSFTGLDADINTQLSSFDGEVSAFTMSYSGGTIVGPFALNFASLFGLVYDLNGGPLGDGLTLDVEGIGASAAVGSFSIGPGPVAVCGTGAICGQIDSNATPVPEPTSLTLALLSCGWLAARRSRRSPKRRSIN